jgi:hypothetical protein
VSAVARPLARRDAREGFAAKLARIIPAILLALSALTGSGWLVNQGWGPPGGGPPGGGYPPGGYPPQGPPVAPGEFPPGYVPPPMQPPPVRGDIGHRPPPQSSGCSGCDLSGCDCGDCDVSGCDLSGCDGCDVSGCDASCASHSTTLIVLLLPIFILGAWRRRVLPRSQQCKTS